MPRAVPTTSETLTRTSATTSSSPTVTTRTAARCRPRPRRRRSSRTYTDPYYDPARQQGYDAAPAAHIPQQPRQPYHQQPQQQPQGYPPPGDPYPPQYDDGRQQPGYGYDTGGHPVHPPARTTAPGSSPLYETGPQQSTTPASRPCTAPAGSSPSTTRAARVYPPGQDYGTGQQPAYETGRQPATRRASSSRSTTAGHAAAGQRRRGRLRPPRGAAAEEVAAPGYRTEQFSFLDEESEESDEVIDWLKFSESRTERREESRRRSRNRKVGLVVILVLALLGGAGYLWQAGKLPGLKKGTAGTGRGRRQPEARRDRGAPAAGRAAAPAPPRCWSTTGPRSSGTTVLIPNSLQVTGDDGSATTLDKSVQTTASAPPATPSNTLLGTDIAGSWRLDSPYLETAGRLARQCRSWTRTPASRAPARTRTRCWSPKGDAAGPQRAGGRRVRHLPGARRAADRAAGPVRPGDAGRAGEDAQRRGRRDQDRPVAAPRSSTRR